MKGRAVKCIPYDGKSQPVSSVGYFTPEIGRGFFSSCWPDKEDNEIYVPWSECKHGIPATQHFWTRLLTHFLEEIPQGKWRPIATAPKRRMILVLFPEYSGDSPKGGIVSQAYFRDFTDDEREEFNELLIEDAKERGWKKPRKRDWFEYGVWSVPEQTSSEGFFTRESPQWDTPISWLPLPPYPA